MTNPDGLESIVQYVKSKRPDLNIFAGWVNKQTNYPCITLYMIYGSFETANEAQWASIPLIQVDTWSKKSLKEASDLAEEFRQLMKGYPNPIELVGQGQRNEAEIYRIKSDYKVHIYLGGV